MSDHGGETVPGRLPPPPPYPAAAEAPVPVDAVWRHVHPATPLLRSWQMLVLAMLLFGRDIVEGLVSGEGRGIAAGITDNVLIGALSSAVLLAALAGWAFLSWRLIRYRVTPDALELDQGVLSRKRRRAPLDRLQSVDTVEPLVARLFGLAKLTLEVAGGEDSKIELAFLTRSQARQLRAHLLAAAGGRRPDIAASPLADEPPEREVIIVPSDRLIGSILLSGATVTLALVAVAAIVSGVVTGEAGFVAFLIPLAVGAGGSVWQKMTRGYGFRISAAGDEVRLRHGLLEQRTQAVPSNRVQAIRLRQPFLWRVTGWWTIDVNVAGYGRGSTASSCLLPVGSRDDVLRVLDFIVSDLTIGDAELIGRGDDGGFTSAPSRARWVDPISWHRHGYFVSEPALLLRRGRLHRSLVVVPHARTQSCGVSQGPIQRRLGLASFELHSTSGPVTPLVEHLASAVAADLLDQQSTRARTARATARG